MPSKRVAKLARYIKSIPDLEIVSTITEGYNHMGATIADAALQGGINYRTVVEPRLRRIMADYPSARTTSEFLKVLDREGVGSVLRWTGGWKPQTAYELTRLLSSERVETEAELKKWMEFDENQSKLLQIKGIGQKTVDYIKLLVGAEAVAVDRYMFRFLADAETPAATYNEAQELLSEAARLLKVNGTALDFSIWKYMSERSASSRKGKKSATAESAKD